MTLSLQARPSLALTLALLPLLAAPCFGGDPAPQPAAVSPWGIATSAGGTRNLGQWLPRVAAAGAHTVRLFPEWGQVEPAKGAWRWEQADALIRTAADSRVEVSGILMGSLPWRKGGGGHAFPMENLDDWSAYVVAAVGRYKGRVRYWEVWNEGNGGFNDGKHTTPDYARLAAASYAAAKRADPAARVGLSVASFDAPYLGEAMAAMSRDGNPAAFDYLCVHPYEIADNLIDPDGEIPYLWMTRMLRGLLKERAPERVGAEVWITEIGRRVGTFGGRTTTPRDAAIDLVKLYVMAAAQGVARIQWFEGQDPVGEDAGFGLIDRAGKARPALGAYQTMTARLGAAPAYVGWLALGAGGRGYGFLFDGPAGPVLVAWMPRGMSDRSLSLAGEVEVIDAVTGATTKVPPGQPIALTDVPVMILNPPASAVAEAKANAGRSFPWGGDFSGAAAVSATLGREDGGGGGVFQTNRSATPHCIVADGSTGIILRGDQGVSFWMHPSFASLARREYWVRVSVRRLAPGNLGMNLFYEVADSRGRSPYKNVGEWYSAGKQDGWQTHTWHVTDASFSKMWGYDISIRPEQSVPFVMGKVEVSTEPLK